MRKADIQVGKTYRNRGKGWVARKVLGMGEEYIPERFYSDAPRPNNIGVWYVDSNGREEQLHLTSFAQWAGSEVSEETS